MQDVYNAPIDGVEVERVDDLNRIAMQAGCAEDYVYAELLRMRDYSSSADRGILPFGTTRTPPSGVQAVTAPTGLANGSVVVQPFRAVIGSPSAGVTPQLVRSGLYTGGDVQLAATAANHRWDLIYARVDTNINDSAVTRNVKAADGSVSPQSVVVTKLTTVTIGVVQGSESATPSRPALPSDAADEYYIPLAYVLLPHPHTLTSTIAASQLDEVAPILCLAPAVGGVDARPAAVHQGSAVVTAWTPAAGRPREYLPKVFTARRERVLVLDFTGGHNALPLNAVTTIDDSCDWRKCLFKTNAQIFAKGGGGWGGSGGSGAVAWTADNSTIQAFPFGFDFTDTVQNPVLRTFIGQSFKTDAFGPVIASSNGIVCDLRQTFIAEMAASSSVTVFVASTGELKAAVSTTSPDCLLFLWIESLGPFSNA